MPSLKQSLRTSGAAFRIGHLRTEHRASGLYLLIAAIVYWNTLYMGRAVEHLRSQGRIVPDEISHMSPHSAGGTSA